MTLNLESGNHPTERMKKRERPHMQNINVKKLIHFTENSYSSNIMISHPIPSQQRKQDKTASPTAVLDDEPSGSPEQLI